MKEQFKLMWAAAKLRLTNPVFYINVGIGVGTIIGSYFGLTGADLTTWAIVGQTIVSAISNPFVVASSLACIYGVWVNTSTPGLKD